jgi:hypothetical protein
VRKLWATVFIAIACSSQSSAPPTSIAMDFKRTNFYDAPFPSEDLRKSDGHIDVSNFPGQDSALIVQQLVQVISGSALGFSSTAGVFFSATAAIDPSSLPDVQTSTTDASSVYLIDADETSPTYKKKIPVAVSFDDDGGPFGAAHQITVLPYQGVPLRAKTRYAAVITSAVRDAMGRALVPSSQMTAISGGQVPFAEMTGALAAIGDTSNVVGLAVYRTDDPLAGMQAVLTDVLARPTPQPTTPLAPTGEVFADYCVYSANIEMPDYQTGTPPYATPAQGGAWTFDAQGKPILPGTQTAGVVVTIPRAAMPANGFPTVVFARAGAGGARPLVDRGVQDANGNSVTGTGPAQELARAGFAGISIDGPLEGLRNPTGDPNQEDFLIFNIANPYAIRDNIRQSAVELVLTAHILDTLTVDASACPTVASASVKFDVTKLALMGHSMGSTISPLATAFEPRFGASIFSGCGGSFIDNVLYKEKPVPIAPLAGILVGYAPLARRLTEGDPAVSLVQWAAESADPPTYGPRILNGSGAPHSVLMFQGIVDHYIMPPMANASTLSFGIDLAGPEIDTQSLEIADFTPITKVLPLSQRSAIALPAQANVASNITGVVVQWPSDGIEDGHEIMFQRQEPKYQYRCFLASYAKGGAPVVPAGIASDALCPLP